MTRMVLTVAAVDLGATSGRVMVGRVGPGQLSLHQIARFPNGPVRRGDGLHWDYAALREHIFDGLREAGATTQIASIGIDAWAVDYGLLSGGHLIADPFHYRDERTAAGVAAVHAAISPPDLYARGGLQFLPFNTLYQLTADRLAGRLDRADQLLLIPDLVAFDLTGIARSELTNASTTGLLGSVSEKCGPSKQWDWDLIDRLDLPRDVFPALIEPGSELGLPSPTAAAALGFSAPVTATASHDTASAVVAVPMLGHGAVYISCGTWGLVGVETDEPIVNEASRAANFTNEGGVFGTTRFLRNVMGLWLLNEAVATWRSRGMAADLPTLLEQAAALTGPATVFDVDDRRFASPGDMPSRIETYCLEHDLAVPETPAAMVRSIIDSLAVAFARTARQAGELAARKIDVIHVVGGGALNALLCQRIADRSELPVVAGPVEATALGNVLIQAQGLGILPGDLAAARELVARHATLTRYAPRSTGRAHLTVGE